MEITDIKFRHFHDEGRLRALVSVTFDGVFAVHDIKIIDGNDRLFLAMPSAGCPTANTATLCIPLAPACGKRWKKPCCAPMKSSSTPCKPISFSLSYPPYSENSGAPSLLGGAPLRVSCVYTSRYWFNRPPGRRTYACGGAWPAGTPHIAALHRRSPRQQRWTPA